MKENMCKDLSEIQVAVNNAFDLKNKELKKKDEEVKSAVGEKEELLKDLWEAKELWDKYDVDLKQKDEQVKTLQELLKNLKARVNDEASKASRTKIEKLTQNVEILLKDKQILMTEVNDLKDDVKSKEIGIKKCRDDFNLFESKISELKNKVEVQANEINEKNQSLTDVKDLQDKIKSLKQLLMGGSSSIISPDPKISIPLG